MDDHTTEKIKDIISHIFKCIGTVNIKLKQEGLNCEADISFNSKEAGE